MIKRYLAAALFFSAAASLAIATCPLSDPSTSSSSTNSPEKSKKCYLVSHNKKKAVCVPADQMASHKTYGDDAGAECPCPNS